MANPNNYSPTPSVLMELREERSVVREGYSFLDEKRLLLASEILKQLETFRRLRERFAREYRQAAETLREAVTRHGLEDLQVYPAGSVAGGTLSAKRHRFLGVPLQSAELHLPEHAPPRATDPSPEARDCAAAFRRLLLHSAEVAAAKANLERLLEEYHRTSRRARALEDVILPELDEAVSEVSSRLEELDQEEAVRTHLPRAGGAQ